jgi:glycosyltransferase involved in cell wall biosynthesis
MKTPRDLTFISPRFLLPADSGGKIRTTQILRGLKGGEFRVTLVMPSPKDVHYDAVALEALSDRLVSWDNDKSGALAETVKKAIWLTSANPIPVVSDWSRSGAAAVERALAERPDIVVFDFPHSAILAEDLKQVPAVMFTHNVEAEIFHRHWKVAKTPLHKFLWGNQYRKMRRYEQRVLARFDMIVAVSERDRSFFEAEYKTATPCRTIPTGVDTEFFGHRLPDGRSQVVFCGSMDWLANIDAMEFFFDNVWPAVRHEVPQARMRVVGRSPPNSLVRRICSLAPEWEFTGFVNDIRDHVTGADAFVIPLRVGGGTRIKAFEAMAMGSPVISTTIGVEGLPLESGVHYMRADTPQDLAASVVTLLKQKRTRDDISIAARNLVQEQYGFRRAARQFEQICLEAIGNRAHAAVAPAGT